MDTEDRLIANPSHLTHSTRASPMPHVVYDQPTTMSNKVEPEDIAYEDELLLKWDDHHKSFFELAEDLCHQELFIDVTLSCGEHNFPAHKLVLSVCSPYFRHLFLRNPCKHPIVVLKDVHFKYMKLLLMYMYRGEVSCPQEDLHGLLRTARSLQIRGLVELERKREAEGFLCNSMTGSPLKQVHQQVNGFEMNDGASTTSCDLDSRGDDFSIDEVRSRLHGQLDIQPISSEQRVVPPPPGPGLHHPLPSWFTSSRPIESGNAPPTTTGPKLAIATSSNDSEGHHSEDDLRNNRNNPNTQVVPDLRQRLKREHSNGNGHGHDTERWIENNGPGSPITVPPKKSRSRPSSTMSSAAAAASNAAIIAAAQAAGMPISALDPSDPMSSVNALLAAAAHGNSGNNLPTSTLSSFLPSTTSPSQISKASIGNSRGGSTTLSSSTQSGQGVDLSSAAMANVSNLQLYYYMQKVAAAGMGNPKERKECPICGKTLYDRSTWNRHMRIHTGEKPYPCRFCGRRFRTNYNKLGHEKKCPDRNSRTIVNTGPHSADSPQTPGPASSTTPVGAVVGSSDFH